MGKRWIKVGEEEVAYGTLSTETFKCMPYRTLDIQPNQNPIAIEESDERMKTGYMYGGFVGSGPLVLSGRPDNMGWFLKWTLGGYSAEGIQDDLYLHRFSQGEAIESFSLEECTGVSGIDNRFLLGCISKRLTIESVMNGPMLTTVETQVRKEYLDSATSITGLPAIRPFALHDAIVQAPSGTTLKAESIRVNIENTVPDDAHTSGSRLLPDVSLEGFAINGELELRFESWAQRQRFYGALVGVAEPTEPQEEVRTVDLSIIWTGPLATTNDYRMDINLPAVMLTENPLATSARERLKQRLNFEAIFHANNRVDLYNALDTYVVA